MLDSGFLTLPRITGLVLVASLAVPLIGLFILLGSGGGSAFSSLLRDEVAPLVPYLTPYRISTLLYALAWMLQLTGLVLLANLLRGSGVDPIISAALVATGVATVLGLLEATFATGVIPWAAQETAATGATPAAFVAMRQWTHTIQLVYLIIALGAQAGFGWALTRTDVVSPGVGTATLAWALLWLLLIVLGTGFPAILFVMPAVIGVALLTG